jgi:hypothetical protein
MSPWGATIIYSRWHGCRSNLYAALSVIVIRRAKGAPPHKSRLFAIIGWLLGFFTTDAVIIAVAGIIWMLA